MPLCRLAGLLTVVALSTFPLCSVGATETSPPGKQIAPGVQRERVNLVLIDVVVTDRKGRRLDDLRLEDFSLKLDGHPHPIQSVELQMRGEVSHGPTAQAPGVGAGERTTVPVPALRFTRRFVLFFDALNSERGLGPTSILAARAFLQKRLPDGDEVMVVGQGRDLKIYQEFTTDRPRMLAALAAVEGDPSLQTGGENRVRPNYMRLVDARKFCTRPEMKVNSGQKGFAEEVKEDCAGSLAADYAREDRERILRSLASLRALIVYLSQLEGRKDLLYFTNGYTTDPGAFWQVARESRLEPEILGLAREAATAQVAVHTVNTQGIPASTSAHSSEHLGIPLETKIEREASDTLATLAIGTGGTATHGTNDFETALVRVEEGTRESYLLAFVPPGAADGLFHSMKVSVRRKGTTVRARQGFLWLTDEQLQEREILSAFVAPELFRVLPLALEARSYLEEGDQPALEIALAVPDESLLFLPREGRMIARLDAGVTLRSGKSKVADQFSRGLEVRLTPDDFASHGDVILLARREVPPGDYEAVAVVRDLGTGNVGALRSPVKVPALSGDRMAMSSLVLESPTSRARRVDLEPSTREDPHFVVPAARRIFPRGAEAAGSCVVYHPQRAAATAEARVRVQGAILKGKDRVKELPTSLRILTANEKADRFPVSFRLPLADLDPGVYTLEVQAVDEVAGRAVIQHVQFMVR